MKGIDLTKSTCEKDLGVILSLDLKPEKHIGLVKEAHSCLFKEANHDNVKRSSVPVVAEGWGGMLFVARAPTKKPAKFHPPPTFLHGENLAESFDHPTPPPFNVVRSG